MAQFSDLDATLRSLLASTSSGPAIAVTRALESKPGADASIKLWCQVMKGRFP